MCGCYKTEAEFSGLHARHPYYPHTSGISVMTILIPPSRGRRRTLVGGVRGDKYPGINRCMSRKRDFAENRGFPPLPHTGELARAALLLEGGGKDPAGSAATNMGPWVEDNGREGPKRELSSAPSYIT